MKIEKIRFNKIKVTFSLEDLLVHNLTAEALAKNSPAAQDIFWDILRRAEEETGFYAENSKLMIEAMPGLDDSLILYITKLDFDEELSPPVSPKKKVKLRIRSVDSGASNGETCLAFDSFEDILSLASSLEENGGRLYFWENRYYLIISSECEARCSEFGKSVPSRHIIPKIEEHGKLICTDALDTVRKYFIS